MIGVIITGHGGFASGLNQALSQVIGEQAQLVAIDFPEGMTTAQLDVAMRQAIEKIDSDEGIVFFSDLLGGSPFRIASLISQEIDNIEVITGTNLQMAAEMLLDRDGLNLADFRQQAVTSGRRGITSLFEQLQEKQREEIEVLDGI